MSTKRPDHVMAAMGEEGDTKYSWDPSDPESVAAAQETFNGYISDGYRPFALSDGTQGEQMTEFNASAGNILMVPPMQGG